MVESGEAQAGLMTGSHKSLLLPRYQIPRPDKSCQSVKEAANLTDQGSGKLEAVVAVIGDN